MILKLFDFIYRIHGMQVEEFQSMPLDEKISYLWDHGLAIHQDRIDDEYTFCIFELEDFYAEAIFSQNKVYRVRIMEEVIAFESYVDRLLRIRLFNS